MNELYEEFKRQLRPELQESFQQLVEIVQNPDPLLDVVLRGHLLVEQRLGDLAAAYAFNPDYITDLRLTFHEKLQLARAFNARNADQPIWAAIAALNSLRNDLAHNLTSSQRSERIQKFLKLVEADLPKEAAATPEGMSPVQELTAALSYIVGSLTSMRGEYSNRARILHLMTRAEHRIFDGDEGLPKDEPNGPVAK